MNTTESPNRKENDETTKQLPKGRHHNHTFLGRSLGRLIFECYKPKTLEETKEYIDFLLTERAILPQDTEEPDAEVLESEIIQTHRKKDFDFLLNHESNTKIRSPRFASYLKIEEEKRRGI